MGGNDGGANEEGCDRADWARVEALRSAKARQPKAVSIGVKEGWHVNNQG